MSVATVPALFYEVAFNCDPLQATVPPYWSDLSSRTLFGWNTTHGKQYELDINEAGEWTIELDNRDGALDPGNAASPYYPNVLPERQCRLRCVLGNNLLLPDQASSGEWSPLGAGRVPPWVGVASLSGYTVSTTVVGNSAYQGTQVFAVTVPSGATAPRDAFDVAVAQVTVGQAYTFSVQAQVRTSGQNPTVNAAVNWLGPSGATLSTTSGSGSVLTGASGTWTQLTASGTGPAGAVAAVLRVVTTTTPGADTVFWCDGLQLEARSYATRWQMPWQTGVNLLPQNVATGLETMNPVSDVATAWFTASRGTLSRATNLTAAPTGSTTALGWALPTGSTPANSSLYAGAAPSAAPTAGAADCFQAVAGQAYTASVYHSRLSSADATVQVGLSVQWYSQANVLLSSTSTTTATVTTSWARASVTGTAPAGAAFGRITVALAAPASTTAANTLYLTGWQAEAAGSVSTWADPGVTQLLYSGYVERWPRTWDELNGTFGTSQLVCVDSLAALAQFTLKDPLTNEILILNPNFCYSLNDPAGTTSVADVSGNRIAAPVEQSPYGAGSLTFGNSVTATSSAVTMVGGIGPVATFNNNATNSGQNPETFISLHKTTTTPGPNGNTWTRIVAVRASVAPGGSNAYNVWQSAPATWSSSNFSNFQIGFSAAGQLLVQFSDFGGFNGLNWASAGSYCDGNWHLVAVTLDVASGNNIAYVDGVAVSTATGTGAGSGWATDTVGCLVELAGALYGAGFKGDAAFVAEFPTVLTAAQVATLYNSFRTASAGESSGARWRRVLSWVGWSGPVAADAGATGSMGPATDLLGSSALDALNNVAVTENGDSFASLGGTMTFKSRSAFYNSRTPVYTFGEGPPVGNFGEWPCEIGSIDFDPAHLANVTQVQQYGGSTYQSADAPSQRRFFPRTFQRTVNTSSAPEARDAATYLLGQLKDPHQRADIIRLHPSAIPGLFAVCARLEKGMRIRSVYRPPGGAPSTTLDQFIQKVDWNWAPDINDVYVDLQASPADLQAYGVLAALHTTLNVQAASGQNKATINALADASTNQLVQSLPSGYSLRFEPGTPRDETLTLAAGGIPATVAPWSTAQLTFTTNFAFTHAATSVVCEPLPTGYTDPTTWDAPAVIGAAYTTVVSGGGSGTNNVTVGPLQDGAYNPLGSTWNGGDLVTLSPGTANAETMTIKSVASTLPGYGSCLITFTANLAHSHPAGDYVCDVLPGGVTNPTSLTPTLRLAYGHAWPALLLFLGSLARPVVGATRLAVPLLAVILAVLCVCVSSRTMRARLRRIVFGLTPSLAILRNTGRAIAHPFGRPASKLSIGMASRARRSTGVTPLKVAPDVLGIRHYLAVRRVATPPVSTEMIEGSAIRYGTELSFVKQPVNVLHPLAEPDFGPVRGCVALQPSPAVGGLVDLCMHVAQQFHEPNSSTDFERQFDFGGN